MKRCPVCNTQNFDDMTRCSACRHVFKQDEVVIPANKVEWFRSRIAEMSRIYADETRSDWFDADDIAREVAEELGRIIEEGSG